jgi:hypothetical protein
MGENNRGSSSGSGAPQRSRDANIAGPGWAALGPGAGDAAPVQRVPAGPPTRTEHLRRVREAHRVSFTVLRSPKRNNVHAPAPQPRCDRRPARAPPGVARLPEAGRN